MSARQAPLRSPCNQHLSGILGRNRGNRPSHPNNLGRGGMGLFAPNPQYKIRICSVSALRRFRSPFSYETRHFSYGKTAD